MDQIKTTLELVREALNQDLRNIGPRDEPWVVLSNLVDNDNRTNELARNAVVMFLARIGNDTTISTYRPAVSAAGGGYVGVTATLYITLDLLFYANFVDANYSQGLALISRVISFFQRNPSFTRSSLPALDPSIEKLAFELRNLDITELNYLMGLIGGKYLPAVLYQVRVIPFGPEAVTGTIPAAKGIDSPGGLMPGDL